MIHGYALAKTEAEARKLPADLRELGAERVWIDTPDSKRAERTALFAPAGLRWDDTLLLLSRSQLGRGNEIARLEAIAAERGVRIRVVELPEAVRRKPGPPPTFRPDYEQERAIRHFWHGPFTRQAARERAEAVMGFPISDGTLNRHLGPRSKPSAWINAAPEQSDA